MGPWAAGLRRMGISAVAADGDARSFPNADASPNAGSPDATLPAVAVSLKAAAPARRGGRIFSKAGRAAGTVACSVAVMLLVAGPLLAAEEAAAPDPADTATGTIFRWLNFLLVMGGIAYLIGKFGAPYFPEPC